MKLAIATGDPAGIGPRIALSACGSFEGQEFLLTGDSRALSLMAREMGLGTRTVECPIDRPFSLPEGAIGLLHAADWPDDLVRRRFATAEGGAAQLAALALATELVERKVAAALVTAPVSKEAIQLSGTDFRGQTEWLARRAGLQDDQVTMLFLGNALRVSLVTTHLPISALPQAVTRHSVERAIRHLDEALSRLDGRREQTIVVCGLNPHAGEAGMFGTEETKIREAIASFPARVTGPVGAETAFRWAQSGRVDGVVAMFHDQATIPSKLLDWTSAVNVTWGLPHIRTSVDHGVAYDAAEAGIADDGSMRAAIQRAQTLVGSE